MTRRPCLGPKEFEEVRTIEYASVVEDVWCALVSEADDRVMRPMRISDRSKASFWSVKYSSNKKGCGPTYDIAKVRIPYSLVSASSWSLSNGEPDGSGYPF